MAELKIDFNNCEVEIGKMFDIHDNQNVTITNNIGRQKSSKPKKQAVGNSSTTPQTLKYYRHGNNRLLSEQQKRVNIVFRAWTQWGWIDANARAEDFDAFFVGEPRHCNITWKANTTILTKLMQELINQPYIEKQTRQSAKSLVRLQFGKTDNSDATRLNEDDKQKINLTCIILNTNNPMPEGNGREYETSSDEMISAFFDVYSGKLRITKGI
ncbi:MAG: hypothetical protein K6E73_09565 [Bacteroidales bacterium]|nr:hypothetical protein [Bacteroidales bacterium]